MKIIVVFLSLFFISCSLELGPEPKGPDVPFKTLQECADWASSTEWVSDMSLFHHADYWQNPDQFWENKKGDCEDKAIFVIWFARKFGIEYKLATIDLNGFKHAVIFDGINYLEPDLRTKHINPEVFELTGWENIRREIRWR